MEPEGTPTEIGKPQDIAAQPLIKGGISHGEILGCRIMWDRPSLIAPCDGDYNTTCFEDSLDYRL